MRLGQISFDFLAIVIFTSLLFVQLFEAYSLQVTSARINEAKISASRVGSILARAINRVSRENGTSSVVTIPESLDTGDSYYLNVTTSWRRVDVYWPISSQNRSVGVAILTANVTNYSASKTAGSGPTTITVSNNNGIISIS